MSSPQPTLNMSPRMAPPMAAYRYDAFIYHFLSEMVVMWKGQFKASFMN